MAETQRVVITPTENGPYWVQGPATIRLPSGREIEIEDEAWLCRCGGSLNKPFCDGTHSRIAFQAAEAAVAAAEGQGGSGGDSATGTASATGATGAADATDATGTTGAASTASETGAAGYEAVADESAVAEGELLGVEVGGQPVVLGRVEGQVYAIGGICSHAYARLEDGELDGDVVMCPLHNSGFNIKTGDAIRLPALEPVPRYDVVVQDGKILVSRQPVAG